MNIFKKLVLMVSTALLSLVLFAAIISFSFNMALAKPNNLKLWLKQNKLYDNIVPMIIDQSNQYAAKSGSGDTALAHKEVQVALTQTFTPVFLQTSIESVIDGTYDWLQGKTPKPNYAIDLSGVKAAFANKLGEAANARLATLPPCSIKNPPTTTDPFTINCQPPKVISEPEIRKYVQDISTSKDFLPETTITPDTTSLNGTETTTAETTPQAPAEAWYKQSQFANLPSYYHWMTLAPYLLVLVIAALMLAIIFASEAKWHGVRVIGSSLISAGVLIGLGAALTLYVFNKFQFGGDTAKAGDIQKPIMDTIQALSTYVSQVQLRWGIGLAIIGLLILIITWVVHPKAAKKHVTHKAVEEPRPHTHEVDDSVVQAIDQAAHPAEQATKSEPEHGHSTHHSSEKTEEPTKDKETSTD